MSTSSAASPVGAAGLPDLVPSAARAAQSIVVAGSPLSVSVKVRNGGSRKASATRTAFYLSRDAKLDRRDVLLGKKKTGSLRPNQTRVVRLSQRVPAGTTPASYRVLACADVGRAVRESREGNNCTASSGSTAVAARYDSTPFGPAEDVTVVPVVDEGASVTEPVEAAAGGRLVLALTDGTEFTLDVPGGALAEDTTITMTALSDVTGHPFDVDAFVAGVRLEPAGLQFEESASLEIVPAAALDPALETPASAQTSGAGFHLHPVEVTPVAARFQLLHFTIVTLLRASDLQRTQQQARRAVDPQAALEQETAAIYSEVRRRYVLEGGDGLLTDQEWDRLAEIFKRYYDVVARPLLVDAANASKCADLAAKRLAVKAGLLWARQVELIGIHGLMGNRIDEMYDLIAQIDTVECVHPNTFTGTASGSVEDQGVTESWSASYAMTKTYDDGLVSYDVTSGSLEWEISGTRNGCTYAGTETFGPMGGDMAIYDRPDLRDYSFRLSLGPPTGSPTKGPAKAGHPR